jgi:hypothetical protein
VCASGYVAVGGNCQPISTNTLLAAKAATCLSCAQNKGCVAVGATCEDFTASAAGGPAAGHAKSGLCQQVLFCALGSGCGSAGDPKACYCGDATDCTGGGTGKCRTQEEDGLETQTPADVLSSFTDPTLGAGRANTIVACLAANNCADCF